MDALKLYAVVMAGGRGERLWPAGRRNHPKQFLKITSEQTMLEETVQRLFPLVAPEHILVMTNRAYVSQIQELLPIPAENIIGEPEGRDTAPCIALATALVRRRDAEATMIVLPADHLIRPAKLFQQTLLTAAQQAQSGVLVTLGIVPVCPSTEYGYLQLESENCAVCRKVSAFKEKPDAATAKKFLRDGNYRWNSGIFIWLTSAISAEFAKHTPGLFRKMESWAAGADYTLDFTECEKISIDYAVMEKATQVFELDVDFYWCDIGSWGALRTVFSPDKNGNIIRGQVIALEADNNILVNDGNGILGVVGLRDSIVINSGNGILVCPISQEYKIKQLTSEIARKAPEFL